MRPRHPRLWRPAGSGLRRFARWGGRAGLLLLLLALLWPVPPERLNGIRPLQMYSREGNLLRRYRDHEAGEFRDRRVRLAETPAHLVRAILTAEDRRFYYHPGVDPIALLRAFRQNLKAGRIVSGASTISQQTARIAYREWLPRRAYWRKPLEIFFALRLELHFSKNQILEAYLSRVPLGRNRAGLPAAARAYFDRDLRLLTPSESIALAVLLRRNRVGPRAFRARYRRLARRLGGDLSPEALDRSQARVFSRGRAGHNSFEISRASRAPHFVDWMRARFPGLSGAVRTELSADLNRTIGEIINEELAVLERQKAGNAAVVVLRYDPRRRLYLLRGLVGSRDYAGAGEGQVNGATAIRSAGSSLKPFVYGMAMDHLDLRPYSVLRDEDVTLPAGDGATYRPRNYDLNFWGPVTLREALAASRNIPAVTVLRDLGPGRFFKLLRRAGVDHMRAGPGEFGTGLALGTAGISLIELSRLYGALAREGRLVPIRLGAVDDGDHDLSVGKRQRLLSPRAALQITHVLSDPGPRRRSFGARSFLDFPFDVAAKTGTSKDYRDAWTVGYTPDWIVGVWVGNFSGDEMNKVSGAFGAGRIFHQVMREVAGEAQTAFRYPADWRDVSLCRRSGGRAGPYCPAYAEYLAPGDRLPGPCSLHSGENNGPNADADAGEIAVGGADVSRPDATDATLIESPITGEVYLIDPHSPRELQAVPLRIRESGRALAYSLNGQRPVPFQGRLVNALELGPGPHVITLLEAGKKRERVEFTVR